MIKLHDMTPEVYYQKSRDFQFIGRLFDLILNYTKTNADIVNTLPMVENADSKLIDLLTMTLGFKSKHNYNIKQLTALCSAFTYILRNKGSRIAIETACQVLFNAEGIENPVSVEAKGNTLIIAVPETLSDLNLLKDLLTYIVPAGTSVNIIKASVTKYGTTTPMVLHSKVSMLAKETDSTTSIVVDPNKSGSEITTNKPDNKPGFIVNTSVIKPANNSSNEEKQK